MKRQIFLLKKMSGLVKAQEMDRLKINDDITITHLNQII